MGTGYVSPGLASELQKATHRHEIKKADDENWQKTWGNKPPPSYAPVYAAALYPELATLARKHGYALAVHGSLKRDFDLIAIPWVENPPTPETVVADILAKFDVQLLSPKHGNEKLHGRRAFTIVVGHGSCGLDLSFMPTITPPIPHHFTDGPMSVWVRCEAFEDQPSAARPCDPSKLAGRMEACCECGDDYPRSELLAGHVHCSKCRDTA